MQAPKRAIGALSGIPCHCNLLPRRRQPPRCPQLISKANLRAWWRPRARRRQGVLALQGRGKFGRCDPNTSCAPGACVARPAELPVSSGLHSAQGALCCISQDRNMQWHDPAPHQGQAGCVFRPPLAAARRRLSQRVPTARRAGAAQAGGVAGGGPILRGPRAVQDRVPPPAGAAAGRGQLHALHGAPLLLVAACSLAQAHCCCCPAAFRLPFSMLWLLGAPDRPAGGGHPSDRAHAVRASHQPCSGCCLQEGARLQLQRGQLNCGVELCQLVVEAYVADKLAPSDEAVSWVGCVGWIRV